MMLIFIPSHTHTLNFLVSSLVNIVKVISSIEAHLTHELCNQMLAACVCCHCVGKLFSSLYCSPVVLQAGFSYNGTIQPVIHQREPLLLLANAAVFSYFCRFCCSANLIFTLLILGVWLLVPKKKKKKNTKERFMCTCRIQLNWRKRGKCSSHILQIYIILQSLYFPTLPFQLADVCLLPFSPNVKKPFTI